MQRIDTAVTLSKHLHHTHIVTHKHTHTHTHYASLQLSESIPYVTALQSNTHTHIHKIHKHTHTPLYMRKKEDKSGEIYVKHVFLPAYVQQLKYQQEGFTKDILSHFSPPLLSSSILSPPLPSPPLLL